VRRNLACASVVPPRATNLRMLSVICRALREALPTVIRVINAGVGVVLLRMRSAPPAHRRAGALGIVLDPLATILASTPRIFVGHGRSDNEQARALQ